MPSDAKLQQFDHTQLGANTYAYFTQGLAIQSLDKWQITNKHIAERIFPSLKSSLELEAQPILTTRELATEVTLDYSTLSKNEL